MSIFKNKVVWITGASSGIGKQIAIQCSKLGANIVLSSRNEILLNAVKNELQGKNHLVLPLDLEHSDNFNELAEEVFKKFGKIDFLFNNGGLSQRSTVVETDFNVDRNIMEINYFGNIKLTKAVLPYMLKQKSGHIVVISSIAGKFGFYLRSAYSASKHALQGFYESLALEEEKNGIKITIAYPGKINTNISLNALNGNGEKYNKKDNSQLNGMPADQCVNKLLKAVEKNKREILIGNKEISAVFLKRFLPQYFFWRIIKRQSAT